MRICTAAVCVALLSSAIASSAAESPRDVASLGFIKGFSWGFVGQRGEYAGPEAAASLKALADTGTQWVCIAFAPEMKTAETPEILFGEKNPDMVTDDEIRRVIDLAGQNKMRVILKPVVNCADGTWRAWVKFYRPVTAEERAAGITRVRDPWQNSPQWREGETVDMEKWDRWWNDFSAFLLHYAKIAEEKKVPVFCLGCEMGSTEQFDDRWRALIAEVRKVYSGFLTYDVNHDNEDNVKWWDAVDFISISAYYAVPAPQGKTPEQASQETTPVADMAARLERVRDTLAKLSKKWNKPILFIETGVPSLRGFGRYPWTHPGERPGTPVDQQEQANYYEAFFKTFWDEPWCLGYVWWDWPARLYDRSAAGTHGGFCIYGKQAEEVLRRWYAKPRETAR